ncbi:uncharacterized protein LOC144462838 [Epinephelus lanceolatus]
MAQQNSRSEQTTARLPVAEQRAEADAKARVSALGRNPGDCRQVLSQMEVLFGQYRGQTFQWLLTHDAGYAAALLASHEAETEWGDGSTPLVSNKDRLLEYARLFPAMAAAITDKRCTGTEAEGDRRVGFGRYCTMTYRQFYETVDAETSSYRNWVRQQTPTKPNSRLA